MQHLGHCPGEEMKGKYFAIHTEVFMKEIFKNPMNECLIKVLYLNLPFQHSVIKH